MNIADKLDRENRLKTNLADWMFQHGTILEDRSHSNEYVGIRIAKVSWRDRKWRIIAVDGMVCLIEKCN